MPHVACATSRTLRKTCGGRALAAAVRSGCPTHRTNSYSRLAESSAVLQKSGATPGPRRIEMSSTQSASCADESRCNTPAYRAGGAISALTAVHRRQRRQRSHPQASRMPVLQTEHSLYCRRNTHVPPLRNTLSHVTLSHRAFVPPWDTFRELALASQEAPPVRTARAPTRAGVRPPIGSRLQIDLDSTRFTPFADALPLS
jgi:hypothetical protein